MVDAFISDDAPLLVASKHRDCMQKGRLKKWNDGKGFGFIQADNDEEEIFFHISSMQRPERRPQAGDVVYFNVVGDETGRRKAVGVSIEGVKSVFVERELKISKPPPQNRKPAHNGTYRGRPRHPRNSANRFFSGIMTVIGVLAIVFAFKQFDMTTLFSESTASHVAVTESSVTEKPRIESQFKCEGKTRCNQMTSCEEAMFYLNHCPGSVTDGDGDGRPCEDQWCGH